MLWFCFVCISFPNSAIAHIKAHKSYNRLNRIVSQSTHMYSHISCPLSSHPQYSVPFYLPMSPQGPSGRLRALLKRSNDHTAPCIKPVSNVNPSRHARRVFIPLRDRITNKQAAGPQFMHLNSRSPLNQGIDCAAGLDRADPPTTNSIDPTRGHPIGP